MRWEDNFVQKALLLKQIERCREEMILLSQSYKMTDDIVIKSSKKLDTLLNEYQNKCEPYKYPFN